METMMFVLWFAVGFVFGSVPSGLWLVKAIHGIDIREYGSKNIGSTNVFRTVGGKTAALVLLCDAGKGCLPLSARCWGTIILCFWALKAAAALQPALGF